MEITKIIKENITKALIADFEIKKETYNSQNKYANSIGIHPSTITNIINRNWIANEKLISNQKWIEIANAIKYNLFREGDWKIAKTKTLVEIWEKIEYARDTADSIIICDRYGIGKTAAIESYAENNDFVYLIDDTRDISTKSLLINELARITGAGLQGKLIEKAQRALSIIKSNAGQNPVLIIDEAGDMNNAAIEWLKKLINQTKGCMGLVLVGSDGLKDKIERGKGRGSNGFGELFSRLGERYLSFFPNEPKKGEQYLQRQAILIARANGIDDKTVIEEIITVGGDMRRVKREIMKYKKTAI